VEVRRGRKTNPASKASPRREDQRNPKAEYQTPRSRASICAPWLKIPTGNAAARDALKIQALQPESLV